jgi:hypothetical protein
MTEGARPRLVLHIGAGKTGSSTIQAMLASNRDRLRRRGVIVPDVHLGINGRINGTQVEYFNSLLPISQASRDEVTKRLRGLADDAARIGRATVIISAENLMNRDEFSSLFTAAEDWFDVVVILYIRRQDDFFMSRWAQWGLKINPDFRAWTNKSIGRAYNWDRLLTTWQSALPKARMLPRVFDRDVLVGGDVAVDFLAALGIDAEGLVDVGGQDMNPRLNEVALRIVSRNRGLFRDHNDNGFTDFLRDFGAPLVFEPAPTGLMWTRKEREQVVAAYAESNERVRASYFSERPEGELFSTRFADDQAELPEPEQVKRELDLLWTVMFNQHSARRRQLIRWKRLPRRMRELGPVGRVEHFARRHL